MDEKRYSFVWNKKNIILAPLKPSETYKDQGRIARACKMREKQEIAHERKEESDKKIYKSVQKKKSQRSGKIEKSGEEKNAEGKKKKKVSAFSQKSETKSALMARQELLVLMYKDLYFSTNDLDSILLNVVVSLLQEFEGLFPRKIPHEQPTLRGKEHQIDFISAAMIPNRPAYQAKPEETKESNDKLMSSWRRSL